jgi:thioester reductase-like protein
MEYLVTGATGFIGRFLIERLARRGGTIHVLVRAGSEGKLERYADRWDGSATIKPVRGDLTKPRLGIAKRWLDEHAGIDHVFHLAAVYDMTASDEANDAANVGGTRAAVEVANRLGAGCFHQVSSVAAAGDYQGTFTEDMFDEGQPLSHAYHRTKFESERIAREETTVPWRVYRPAVVVGDSKTGEMDKLDGPYYFFQLLRGVSLLPSGLPIVVPDLGRTNIVPVDFVADAMDALGHKEGLDHRAFHLTSPREQRIADVLSLFSRIAGGPRFVPLLPKAVWQGAQAIPGTLDALERLGIPRAALEHSDFATTFTTKATEEALAGTGIEVPPLEDYAERLWRYWEAELR